MKFHVADGVNLSLAATSNRRTGEKASLARGATGSAVPGVKTFDTNADELRLGGAFIRGAFASDLLLRLGQADGQRATDAGFVAVDDQKRYEGRLGVTYDISAATRVLAHGALYRLESATVETHGATTTPMDGDTDVGTAQLGLIQRLGPGFHLRLSAMLQNQDTEAVAGPYTDIDQGVDRERSRQEYRVGLFHNGLPRTALRLQYRYRATDLEESVGLGGLPGYDTPTSTQSQDQDRTAQDVVFGARYTFSPSVKIKARVSWKSEEVEQTSTWTTADPFLPLIGDYTRDRLDWQVSLPCRLGRTVLLDLGHQAISQTYEVTADGTETTWDATRGFANVNWLPTDRITVYGTAAVGIETYEVAGGLAPAAGLRAHQLRRPHLAGHAGRDAPVVLQVVARGDVRAGESQRERRQFGDHRRPRCGPGPLPRARPLADDPRRRLHVHLPAPRVRREPLGRHHPRSVRRVVLGPLVNVRLLAARGLS